MKEKQAILCIDIDGTLINSKYEIHPRDIQILLKFPEVIQPILTTGRSLQSAKGVLQANGLFTAIPLPLAGVFMNGGVAYLPNEVLCVQHSFPPQTRDALITLAANNPRTTFSFFSIDAVHLVNTNPFSEHIAHRNYLNAHIADAWDVPQNIIKVMVIEQSRRMIEKIKMASKKLEIEMAYSLPYLFEINPSGITKAETLRVLLKKIQLDDLPIFVVGDAENDLSLFELARESIAPETAHTSILARSNHIIPQNKDGLLMPILGHINS